MPNIWFGLLFLAVVIAVALWVDRKYDQQKQERERQILKRIAQEKDYKERL